MTDLLTTPAAFWLAAAAMTIVALLFVLPRLWRGQGAGVRTARAATNAAIYRDAAEELERAHAAGDLTAAEHAEARAILERRLLDETAGDEAPAAPAANSRHLAVAMSLVLPVFAFALYALFGDPSAMGPDSEASTFDLVVNASDPGSRDALLRHLERHPRDGRGWVLLARADAAADHFGEAAQEFERALAVSPKVAADAGVWCEYADALGMAQGGQLAGKPRELVLRALALSPMHPKALEMAGSAAYEAGEFAAAARYWRDLAGQIAEGSSRRELLAAISRADRLAMLNRSPAAATLH